MTARSAVLVALVAAACGARPSPSPGGIRCRPTWCTGRSALRLENADHGVLVVEEPLRARLDVLARDALDRGVDVEQLRGLIAVVVGAAQDRRQILRIRNLVQRDNAGRFAKPLQIVIAEDRKRRDQRKNALMFFAVVELTERQELLRSEERRVG